MTHDREPVGIADALSAVRAELGLPSEDTLARLEDRWAEVVGDDVATHARLVALHDGVATIAVDSPPWATQLRFLESTLLARANAIAGADVVRAITVRVRGADAAN